MAKVGPLQIYLISSALLFGVQRLSLILTICCNSDCIWLPNQAEEAAGPVELDVELEVELEVALAATDE